MVPDILDISQDMVAQRGQNISLRCGGTGDSPLNVSWIRPSGEVHVIDIEDSTGVFWDFEDNTFTIVSASDGGTYTCIAENEGGSANSSVEVYVTPYFITEPLDLFATNGSFQSVTCRAEAFPSPNYIWVALETPLFDVSGTGSDTYLGGSGSSSGRGLGSGDHYMHGYLTNNKTLVFDPVIFGDEGFVYSCIASNEFGVIYTSINMTGKKWL